MNPYLISTHPPTYPPTFPFTCRLLPLLIASIPLVLPLLTTPQPANAIGRDPRQLLKEKEARKAKLREAAAAMKAKGITEDAFKDSKYALPEEARTPNLRTLSVSFFLFLFVSCVVALYFNNRNTANLIFAGRAAS